MPPKKLKTRHTSGNCFGSSAELPDDGDLFTMRDVLAACERELEVSRSSTNLDIADRMTPKIVAKWNQNNPELILIASKGSFEGDQTRAEEEERCCRELR